MWYRRKTDRVGVKTSIVLLQLSHGIVRAVETTHCKRCDTALTSVIENQMLRAYKLGYRDGKEA